MDPQKPPPSSAQDRERKRRQAEDVQFWAAVRELVGVELAAKARLEVVANAKDPSSALVTLAIPGLPPITAGDHEAILEALRERAELLAEESGEEGPAVDAPGNGAKRDEPELDVDAILKANGFAHIRGQVVAVVEALGALPRPALRAAVAFAKSKRQGPEPLPPATADAIDRDLWLFEAVYGALDLLEEVEKRVAARNAIRGR